MTEHESFYSQLRLFCSVRLFNIKDFFKTVFYFWRKPKFAICDLTLLLAYFLKSPYRIVREFTKGSEPYGETPLVTMQEIIKRAGVTKNDRVLECGAGRGRTTFWLALFSGIETVAVEHIEPFVYKAETIARWYSIKKASFVCEDMFALDWSSYSIIYLFGTCLTDDEVLKLKKKVQALQKGTKVITISYPIDGIDIIDQFEVSFAWGKTDCFIHER